MKYMFDFDLQYSISILNNLLCDRTKLKKRMQIENEIFNLHKKCTV